MKPPTKPAFICASCARLLHKRLPAAVCAPVNIATAPFATTSRDDAPSADAQLPRYRQTPPAMKMPYRLRPQPKQPVWRVNEDERVLDEAYDHFLGRVGGDNVRGRDLLDEQTKWLAITHKSFDHGRQGFNDRLAFLGKRIVEMQTSLALLNAPTTTTTTFAADPASSFSSSSATPPTSTEIPNFGSTDPNDRPSRSRSEGEIFQHPALEGIENVTAFAKHATLSPRRLAQVASRYGLEKVVRWKPKKSDNLQASGMDVVMAQALFGVIGALALRSGGEVAARAARERILHPLGLR